MHTDPKPSFFLHKSNHLENSNFSAKIQIVVMVENGDFMFSVHILDTFE